MLRGPARGRRTESALEAEEYAAARRPDLVRLCVLLGSPPEHAALIADRTLARVRADWAELVAGDPDVQLLELALEQRALDRTPWWEQVRPDEVLPRELAALDRLDPTTRARLVWAVLGRGPAKDLEDGGDQPTAPGLLADVARVAAGVPLTAAAAAGAVEPLRSRSRGRSVLAAAAAAVVVGLLVVAVLPDDRPAPEAPLGPVVVDGRPNPAPVAWYADGRIHLSDGVAEVSGVEALVELGAGVVYLGTDGRVVDLRPDGTRTVLGRGEAGAGLVGNAVFGRVAWVTPDGWLEVADVPAAQVLARREVGSVSGTGPGEEPVRLVRMAGSLLLWTAGGREYEWDTAAGTLREEEREEGEGVLVDVVGTTELRQLPDGTVTLAQQLGARTVLLGTGGEISPRQQFVLTRSGEGSTGVRVFSVGAGEEIASGTTGEDVVLDARFTDADRITYLLADRAALPDASGAGRVSGTGPLEVRTCQVRTGRCVTHATGAGAGESAVLLAR